MSWRRSDQDEILPPEPRKPGNGRIRLALLVLVLALGSWYLAAQFGPARREPEATHRWAGERPGPDAGTTGRIPREETPPPAAVPPPGPSASESGGDRARAIIAELRQGASPGLSRAYAQAEAFRDGGHPVDAYLLYFYAARLGHAPSALALGTMADPQFYRPGTDLLDAPDMAQAYKWYKVAADQGDATARQRLAGLRLQVEAAAATGNGQAQRLLLEWR